MDVWPLRPNWRDPVRITYSYQTEVISSRTRREQRRALRQTPRRSVQFSVLANKDRFRALMRTFATNQGPVIAWPDITRGARLLVAPTGGSPVVVVHSTPEWAVAGGKAILVLGDQSALMTVQSVSASTITFTANAPAFAYGVKVCPAFEGRLPVETATQALLPGIAEATIRIDQDPGSEPARYPGEADTLWNGREVFLKRGNWGDPRDVTFSNPYEMVDYGRGRVQAFMPSPFETVVRSVDYIAWSQAEADDYLRFYERCKGQLREIYVPTDDPDMVLVTGGSGGTTQLTLAGTDLATAYASDPVHKAISVKMTDGRRFFAKVDTLTVNGGNTRLTMLSPMPYSVSPNNVEVISWLPVMRLASDDVTFEWLTDQHVQVRFTYQTLPDAPAE